MNPNTNGAQINFEDLTPYLNWNLLSIADHKIRALLCAAKVQIPHGRF
jgi:hypothetical protein